MGWGYATLGLGLLLLIATLGLFVSAMVLHPRTATEVSTMHISSDGSPTVIRLKGAHDYGLVAEDDQVTCDVVGPQQEPIEVKASTTTTPKTHERLQVHIEQTGDYEVSCIARSTVRLQFADSDPDYQRSFSLFLATAPVLACSIPLILGRAVVLVRARRRRARELIPQVPSHPDPQWGSPVVGAATPQAAAPAPAAPPAYTQAYPGSVYGSAAYPGQVPQSPPAGQTAPPPPQHPYPSHG